LTRGLFELNEVPQVMGVASTRQRITRSHAPRFEPSATDVKCRDSKEKAHCRIRRWAFVEINSGRQDLNRAVSDQRFSAAPASAAVARFGPTTPKLIDPELLRSMRPKQLNTPRRHTIEERG
jgi:hypothetical protein